MPGLRKIDSVMVRVTDLDASARFYEEVMGLKRAWTDNAKQMVGFLFPGNDSELVIYTGPSWTAHPIASASKTSSSSARGSGSRDTLC